jgi:hypothetical protein
MPTGSIALLRTAEGRSAFRRIAGALVLVTFGSGVLLSVWVHALTATGYAPPEWLADLLGRYLRGEPSVV